MFSPSNIYTLATITPSGVAGTLNVASDTVLYIRPLTPSETAGIATATCAVAYVPQVSGATGEPIEVYSTTAAATISTALEATFSATVTARGALTFSPSQTWYFGAALIYAPSLVTSGSGAKFQMDYATVDTFTVTDTVTTIKSRIAAAKSAADLPASPTFSGDVTIGGVTINSVDVRAGAGAVSVTSDTTQITTTGVAALTLANGTHGQRKTLVMTVDGGDATLTPTTKTGYTSVTFNDVGDALVLEYFTTLGWMVISNYGCTVTP